MLFDDDAGVMRFAAWRGLSDAYRRAVEGHSAWVEGVFHAAKSTYGDLGRSRARSHVANQLSRDVSLLAGPMAIHSA
jgi:hypothetical protein